MGELRQTSAVDANQFCLFLERRERERERFFCCRGKMPAAPPNVDSIRKAVEGGRRSANQSVVMSLRGLELVADDEKYVQDESELEIPPGVDTPWSFGSFIRYFGPGWLVCIAYVDPGNYQADIQSGAQTGYSQNWVILWTQLLSWYVQYMCVKLQHYTNTNLAEAMALQYPKYIRWLFWVIAEVSIILTDLPEVIGFAIAINLFNPSVPLFAGVLLSFLSTMVFLASLSKGSYFIELTACALVVIMSIVLSVEWDMAPTDSVAFAKGAFLPLLPMDASAIQSIIGIIGAVVMPHNLYLHSGALESRRAPNVEKYKRQAVWLGLWDPFIPILSTTVVNWAIAALAAIFVFSTPTFPKARAWVSPPSPSSFRSREGRSCGHRSDCGRPVQLHHHDLLRSVRHGRLPQDQPPKVGQGNHHPVRRCRPLRHRCRRLGRQGHGAHDRRRQLLPRLLAAICSDPPDQAHNKQAVHGRQVCGQKVRALAHLGGQPALLRDQLLHVGCAGRSVLWTVHLDGYGGWRPNEHHPGSRVRLLHRLLRLHGFRPGEGISIADQAGDGRPSDRHGARSKHREEECGDDQPTTMKS